MVEVRDIWHARVVTGDEGRVEHYHFANKQDVLTSIATTWEKVTGAFVTSGLSHIRVSKNGRTMLYATLISGEILSGPTHF